MILTGFWLWLEIMITDIKYAHNHLLSFDLKRKITKVVVETFWPNDPVPIEYFFCLMIQSVFVVQKGATM